MNETIAAAIFTLSIPVLVVLSIFTNPILVGVLLGVVTLGLILALILQQPLGRMLDRRSRDAVLH